ncbi:hypothetical protein ACWATR_24185 [Nostoc sp. UIC 10890]|jgi:hypothetical protein
MADSVNPQAATAVSSLTSKKANATSTVAYFSETHNNALNFSLIILCPESWCPESIYRQLLIYQSFTKVSAES